MKVFCSQPIHVWFVWKPESKQIKGCTLGGYAYLYVCVCGQPSGRSPQSQWWSHAFPMLTHTKQWVPPHVLSCFHPVMSSSPLLLFLSLRPSLLLLSSHFVLSWFSAWPHLWIKIITKRGHCVLTVILRSTTRSRLLVVFVLLSWPNSTRAPVHTSVHSEIALGGGGLGRPPSVRRILEHCVHAVLDVKEWWLRRMWHGFAECQPIKFSYAKAIFVFQMLCWIAKYTVYSLR